MRCETSLEGSQTREKQWRRFNLAESIVSILKAATVRLLPWQAYQPQLSKNRSPDLMPGHPEEVPKADLRLKKGRTDDQNLSRRQENTQKGKK